MHTHTHTHAENGILKNKNVLFELIVKKHSKKYHFFTFVANHTNMSLTVLSSAIFANNICVFLFFIINKCRKSIKKMSIFQHFLKHFVRFYGYFQTDFHDLGFVKKQTNCRYKSVISECKNQLI